MLKYRFSAFWLRSKCSICGLRRPVACVSSTKLRLPPHSLLPLPAPAGCAVLPGDRCVVCDVPPLSAVSAWCCVVCVAAPYCRCHVCRPLIPLCCVMSQPLSPPRVSDGQPVLRDGLLTIPFPLPPVLLCPVENCGTRYANTVPTSMRQSLKRHIVRAHPGLLSATVWKCLGCGDQIVYPSRHVCRAQGLPPTPVTMPHTCGCGGSFTTRRGLTNHRRYCRLSPTRSLPSLPGDVSTDIDYDDLSDHARAICRSVAVPC